MSRARWMLTWHPNEPPYILRDEFLTDRAAGAVNGTPAEPGPGENRAVVDTGNLVSISGGKLVFAGGSALGDPNFSLAVARQTGLLGVFSVLHSAGTWRMGLPAATTMTKNEFVLAATNLQVGITGTNRTVGTIVLGTQYELVVALRATGAFYFIKGGTFTEWTLVGICPSYTDASLYTMVGSATGIGNLDFIGVPRQLWLPVPSVSDGFDTAWGTSDGLGHAEGVAGGLGADGDGISWVPAVTTWSVSAGKAVNTPTQGSELLTNGDMEGAFVGGVASGWSVMIAGDTPAEENTIVHGGSKAQKITWVSTDDSGIKQTKLTNHVWYRVDGWFRANQSRVIQHQLSGSTTSFTKPVTADTWTNVVNTGRATGTVFYTYVSVGQQAGDLYYWDDYSIKPLAIGTLITAPQFSTANVYAAVDIWRTTGLQVGLALNINPDFFTAPDTAANQDFILVYLDGSGNCRIDECVNGVYTNKTTTTVTYVAGARLVAIKEDATTIRVFYNTIAVATVSTLTGNNNLCHGLFNTGNPTENQFDNFVCYARGNEGQHSFLDKFIS